MHVDAASDLRFHGASLHDILKQLGLHSTHQLFSSSPTVFDVLRVYEENHGFACSYSSHGSVDVHLWVRGHFIRTVKNSHTFSSTAAASAVPIDIPAPAIDVPSGLPAVALRKKPDTSLQRKLPKSRSQPNRASLITVL